MVKRPSSKVCVWVLFSALAWVGCEPEQKPAAPASSPTLRGQPIRRADILSNQPPVEVAKTMLDETNTSTVPRMIGEFTVVGFDRLSGYHFEMTDDILAPSNQVAEASATVKTTNQIPATIRALDKKRVALKGFMLPLKVERGRVTEMLIMRDQSMCCFGTVPKINEWVSVKTSAEGVKPIMDEPVTVVGTLHVGEMRENGYLVGIYRMDGEKLVDGN